jgi:hypothetical protein
VTDVDAGHPWGDDLPPFSTLVAAMADLDPTDGAAGVDDDVDVEEIALSLAIELAVRDDGRGVPRVRSSTPTQWTETTVMPVYHRLSLRIARAPDA